SPGKISYRMPEDMAPGIANVVIAAGASRVTGSINIVDVYPNLFAVDAPGTSPSIRSATDKTTLTIYGSGMGRADASAVTATIGGEPVDVTFAGRDTDHPGQDRYDLLVPPGLAGQG